MPRVYLTLGGGFLRWRSLIDAIQSVIFFGYEQTVNQRRAYNAIDVKKSTTHLLAGILDAADGYRLHVAVECEIERYI